MPSEMLHRAFLGLTVTHLALHLFVSGSAALPKVRGLLQRSLPFIRGVAAWLWEACVCSAAGSSAYEDAVRQSLLLRRKQVWGNSCHCMAMIDMLFCVSSIDVEKTSVLQSEPARFIIMARWAVALVGARFHNRFGDHMPIACYVIVMVLNCLYALIEVSPFYVTVSAGIASVGALSSLAIPGNVAVLLSFLVGGVFFHQDTSATESMTFAVWFAHRCWVLAAIMLTSWVAKGAMLAEAKHKVELSLSSAEATAVRAALYSVCDAVVELDKDLQVSGRADKLAGLLMRSAFNLEGRPFSELIMRDEDKAAFEDAARSEGEGAEVVMSRMALRDSMGTPVDLVLCRVPFKHLSKTRHLVGMWESGRKRAAEGEAAPAREDVVQLPEEPEFPVLGGSGERSLSSSEDSQRSQRRRKRARPQKRLPLGIGQALTQDVFDIEGLMLSFDCTLKIISYVWPDSRRVPGCGDHLNHFLVGDDGTNAAYHEAHHDCCTQLMDTALAAPAETPDTISAEFETTWVLSSQRWPDTTMRVKARVHVLGKTTSCAEQSERPSCAKSNIVMEATISEVLVFRAKPTAQSL